jgi:hypothetical protein
MTGMPGQQLSGIAYSWLRLPPGRREARRAPRPARLLRAETPPSTRWRPPWRRAPGRCRVGGRRRCRTARRVLAEVRDGGDDFGELIWVFEVGREEAVVPGGPAQRSDVAGKSRDPHRHPGLRHRSGQALDAVDGVVLAAVVDRRTGPGGGENLGCLVEQLASQPVIELLAGFGQLAAEAVAAEADAEGEAATAEPVQRRGFPGDLGRPAAGQGRDHGAEPQMFGGGGDRRQRDPRVAHLPDRRPPEQVVPHKDPCPPASSASAARRATTAGSARASKIGSQRAERIPVRSVCSYGGVLCCCRAMSASCRRRVLLRSCPARRLPDPGPGHNPWTGPSQRRGPRMNGPAGDRPQSNAAPAWPRAKLGATPSTAGTKHNTLPGRLLTTLRSLTVIHIQPPGSWRRHERGASFLEPPARSMVWTTSPGAMACSWHASVSWTLPRAWRRHRSVAAVGSGRL